MIHTLPSLRRAHPVLYSVAAVLATVLLILLAGLTVQFVAAAFFPQGDYYVVMFWQELLAAAAVYGLLRVSGCGRVLLQKGCGLGRGLLIGIYPLVLIVFAGASNLALVMAENAAWAPWYHSLAFLGTMLLIGLTEELAFRGLVAGTLLEAFGPGRAGIWKAAALSGALFGAAHLSNALGASLPGVCIQMAVTSVLGMLFAAIYFRSGNLWVTILLHAAMDTVGLIGSGLFIGTSGGDTVAEAISAYGLINLTPAVTYLLPTLFLLRRTKVPEIQRLWTGGSGPQRPEYGI